MVDNELQDLLNDFGVNPDPTPPAEPVVPDPATPPATDPVPPVTPPANPEPTPEQPGATLPAQPVPPAKPDNSIKQLREAYSQTKQEAQQQRALLERIAASRGVTVEALSEQLKAEEDKRIAKERGIPEEIQKTMREQAERLEILQKDMERERFQSTVRNFQVQNQLTDDQVIEFLQAAGKANIDLVRTPVPLDTLYFAMNRSTIEAKIRQAERQAVYEELKKQGNGNVITKLNPGSTTPKKGLDDLLADIAKSGIK